MDTGPLYVPNRYYVYACTGQLNSLINNTPLKSL